MILDSVDGVSLGISARQYDLVLAASGFESRSRSILEALPSPGGRRVVVGFSEFRNDMARPANDRAFATAGYETICESGNSSAAIRSIMCGLLENAGFSSIRLLIDISSMTRVWYSAVVQCLRDAESSTPVVVDFVYFRGQYPDDYVQAAPNEVVSPLVGFASFLPPALPTALVLGLGFDIERAVGLMEYLEPRRTIGLVAGTLVTPLGDSWSPDEFRIRQADALEFYAPLSCDVLGYPLQRPGLTFSVLSSLVEGLKPHYRVVSVSLGPKMLGVLLLLISARFPDVSVWRVSAGRNARPVDVGVADEEPILCRTRWNMAPQRGPLHGEQ